MKFPLIAHRSNAYRVATSGRAFHLAGRHVAFSSASCGGKFRLFRESVSGVDQSAEGHRLRLDVLTLVRPVSPAFCQAVDLVLNDARRPLQETRMRDADLDRFLSKFQVVCGTKPVDSAGARDRAYSADRSVPGAAWRRVKRGVQWLTSSGGIKSAVNQRSSGGSSRTDGPAVAEPAKGKPDRASSANRDRSSLISDELLDPAHFPIGIDEDVPSWLAADCVDSVIGECDAAESDDCSSIASQDGWSFDGETQEQLARPATIPGGMDGWVGAGDSLWISTADFDQSPRFATVRPRRRFPKVPLPDT